MEKLTIFVEQLFRDWNFAEEAVRAVSPISLAAVALIVAFCIGLICSKLLVPLLLKITAKTRSEWDDILLNRKVLVSASRVITAVIVWLFLPAVFYRFPMIEMLLSRFTAIYITIMSVSTILTFINSLKQLDTSGNSTTHQYIHSFCGVLKIVVIFIAVIVVLAIVIDRSPMTLLAGLGATSAILMLVFQDTIKGLVAGVRLTSNDMLHIGDWITVPKAGVDGTVIEMSLTTVKVRNWDNTILTISPQTLVDDSFQNWKGMQDSDGRRVKRKVYYDFSSIRPIDEAQCKMLIKKGYFKKDEIKAGDINMTLYRRYMERYLTRNAEVNKDMLIMVRQLEATNTGLPVEFYFFLSDKTWINYEHNLADIMDSIYGMTPDFGLNIYQLQYSETNN